MEIRFDLGGIKVHLGAGNDLKHAIAVFRRSETLGATHHPTQRILDETANAPQFVRAVVAEPEQFEPVFGEQQFETLRSGGIILEKFYSAEEVFIVVFAIVTVGLEREHLVGGGRQEDDSHLGMLKEVASQSAGLVRAIEQMAKPLELVQYHQIWFQSRQTGGRQQFAQFADEFPSRTGLFPRDVLADATELTT
jgi:hypothetical protein